VERKIALRLKENILSIKNKIVLILILVLSATNAFSYQSILKPFYGAKTPLALLVFIFDAMLLFFFLKLTFRKVLLYSLLLNTMFFTLGYLLTLVLLKVNILARGRLLFFIKQKNYIQDLSFIKLLIIFIPAFILCLLIKYAFLKVISLKTGDIKKSFLTAAMLTLFSMGFLLTSAYLIN
jgi:hypothetical protein